MIRTTIAIFFPDFFFFGFSGFGGAGSVDNWLVALFLGKVASALWAERHSILDLCTAVRTIHGIPPHVFFHYQ